jgi:F0F1-type ATP synthase assembly protein I
VTNEPPRWPTLLGIGGATAAVIIAGLGLGFVADRFLHTFPIFVFVGLVIGIAGASRYIYGQFRSFYRD